MSEETRFTEEEFNKKLDEAAAILNALWQHASNEASKAVDLKLKEKEAHHINQQRELSKALSGIRNSYFLMPLKGRKPQEK